LATTYKINCLVQVLYRQAFYEKLKSYQNRFIGFESSPDYINPNKKNNKTPVVGKNQQSGLFVAQLDISMATDLKIL